MLLLYGLRYEIQHSAWRIAPNLTFSGKPNNACGCDWQKVKQTLICRHRIYNHRGMLTSHRPTWEAALSANPPWRELSAIRSAVSVNWLLMRVFTYSFHWTRAGSVQGSCINPLSRALIFLFTQLLLKGNTAFILFVDRMSGATFTYTGHSVAGVIWFWVNVCTYIHSLLFTISWVNWLWEALLLYLTF